MRLRGVQRVIAATILAGILAGFGAIGFHFLANRLDEVLFDWAGGRALYILDEPTTGLHFHDVAKLLEVLFKLRAAGGTLVVIEHNLDVIKTADWIIDLGPEGGAGGGMIVAEGTPEAVAANPRSITGQFLHRVLKRNRQ